MEKKYELLKDDWQEVEGQRVYRIRALKDFMFDENDPGHRYPGIRKGTLGGYIQSESNLSHEGDCWIGGEGSSVPVVYGGSKVEGSGIVSGDVKVKNSHVTGFIDGERSVIENSQILDNSWVHLFNGGVISGCHMLNNAEVRFGGHIEHTVIAGDAKVEGSPDVKIYGSRINGNARVTGYGSDHKLLVENSFVEDDVIIREGATVIQSTVCDHSIIAGQADVRSSHVAGKAGIGGNAKLDDAVVIGQAMVYGDANVSKSKIEGNAHIYDKAVVEQSIVAEDARVFGDAVVKNFKFKEIIFTETVGKGVHNADHIALSLQAEREREHRDDICYICPNLKHQRDTEDGKHVPLYAVYTKEKDHSLAGYSTNLLALCDTLEEAVQGAKEQGYTNIVTEGIDKKYELAMDEASTTMFGRKHYRIRALRDIPSQGVTVGKLGGYVENENNLSQEGNCWIAHNALVSGDARVEGDAVVSGWANVSEKAVIKDKAMVSGNAAVSGNAVAGENAFISGFAVVTDDAKVLSHATVKGNAQVCGSALVGDATVTGNAIVMDSRVWGGSEVAGNAVVVNRAVVDNGIKLSGNDYVEGKGKTQTQTEAVKKRFQNKRSQQKKKNGLQLK